MSSLKFKKGFRTSPTGSLRAKPESRNPVFLKLPRVVQEHCNSVTARKNKFACPTEMTSSTIKIRGKPYKRFHSSANICCVFSSFPVIMAALKDSKRQTIVCVFSIFLWATFIFSTDTVYESDNTETQRDQSETAFLKSGRKAVNHENINIWQFVCLLRTHLTSTAFYNDRLRTNLILGGFHSEIYISPSLIDE